MMAVIAEGRNYDRDDTLADAKIRGCPVLCPLKAEEIASVLESQRPHNFTRDAGAAQSEESNKAANKLTKSIFSRNMFRKMFFE